MKPFVLLLLLFTDQTQIEFTTLGPSQDRLLGGGSDFGELAAVARPS